MIIAAESAPELARLCARQGSVRAIVRLNNGQIEIEIQGSIEPNPLVEPVGPNPSPEMNDGRALALRNDQPPVLTAVTPPLIDHSGTPMALPSPVQGPPAHLQRILSLSSPTQPESNRVREIHLIHLINCTSDGVLNAIVDGRHRKIRVLGSGVIRLARVIELLTCRVFLTTVRYMGRGRDSDMEVDATELLGVILDACRRVAEGAAEEAEKMDYGLDSICDPLA